MTHSQDELTWDEEGPRFALTLAQHMQLGLDLRTTEDPNSDLFEEWALDSLQAVEMILTIEAMADVTAPRDLLPEFQTVRDAYSYYRWLINWSNGNQSPAN